MIGIATLNPCIDKTLFLDIRPPFFWTRCNLPSLAE